MNVRKTAILRGLREWGLSSRALAESWWQPPSSGTGCSPGVTFVLQDGWLCMAWTLLTLSHWWASRRGYKRNTFPTSCCWSRNEQEIYGPGAMWFFFSIYLLNLNFVSDIETHTLWKLTYKKKKKEERNPILGILSLLRLQLRSSRLLRQMKNVPPLLWRCWYAPLIDPHCSISFWFPCII